MKRLFTLITAVLITATIYSQAPDKLSYQAVVRNADGVLVQSSNVRIKISLLQGASGEKEVYTETHNIVTNINGLATLEIGGGKVVSGNFVAIDWSAGPYFLKTETDPKGGTNYTITGTSELLSVPYALFSANGTPGPQGQQGPQGPTGVYPVHTIGESYGGGIVFYVYDNGQHGLIAATADQSTGIRWYAGTYTYAMAKADGVGAGKANTTIIIANLGYGDGTTYAARICNEYSVTVGSVTYADWYLPSKHELHLLYLQKAVVSGFSFAYYWSSTEYDNLYVGTQSFNNDYQVNYGKAYVLHVRAIRAF